MFEQLTGYPGIFLLCLLAGIGLPFPEDVAVALVGVQVESQAVALLPAIGVAAVGVFCRDLIVWTIGRYFGDWALRRPWINRLLGGKRIERARAMVLRRGGVSVLTGRMFIGMRIPIFFVTGTMGIPLRTFAKWDCLGLLVTTPLLVSLGVYLGAPMLNTITGISAKAGWIPWVVIGLLVVVFAAKVVLQKKRRSALEEDSVHSTI